MGMFHTFGGSYKDAKEHHSQMTNPIMLPIPLISIFRRHLRKHMSYRRRFEEGTRYIIDHEHF